MSGRTMLVLAIFPGVASPAVAAPPTDGRIAFFDFGPGDVGKGYQVDNDGKNLDLSGLLAMQLHSGPPMKVQFKDIRLKVLAPAGGK